MGEQQTPGLSPQVWVPRKLANSGLGIPISSFCSRRLCVLFPVAGIPPHPCQSSVSSLPRVLEEVLPEPPFPNGL